MQPARKLPQSPFNIQHDTVLEYVKNDPKRYECLHQHQIDAILAAKKQLENPNQPNIALVVLPTGCGKTGVAVLCPYVLNSSRVLVITPSETVSKQIHQAFCGKPPPNAVQPFLTARGTIEKAVENYFLPIGAFIDRSSKIRDAHIQHHVVVVNAHKVGGQSSVGIDEIPSTGYDLVIVDEAHHYPAPTWKHLVDHFRNSKRLFLTATPEWRGKSILESPHLQLPPIHMCYHLSHKEAIERGIIRDSDFDEISDEEANPIDDMAVYAATARHIEYHLNQHDQQDGVRHQAMVLTQARERGGINAAEDFVDAYKREFPNSTCAAYVTGTSRDVLERFKKGEIRTLVIIGKLLEGFDHKWVSVVGIVRNVAKQSRVLFAQFIGRAVRKLYPEDRVKTMVVAHSRYKQRENYMQFDRVIAEVDPADEDN